MADRIATQPRSFTAVLPCAGSGERFRAPYPKELHCLETGRTVLDHALDPVLALADAGARVRIVAVLSTAKLATAEHLARYADRVELVFTYQSPRSEGVPGALAAAVSLSVGPIALILPDQHFRADPVRAPLRRALALAAESPCAVLAAHTDQPDVLRAEGALRLVEEADGHRVAAAADKPADPAGFNAAWAAVVCANEFLPELSRLFDRTAPSPLVGAPAVLVDGYRHWNTPEAR